LDAVWIFRNKKIIKDFLIWYFYFFGGIFGISNHVLFLSPIKTLLSVPILEIIVWSETLSEVLILVWISVLIEILVLVKILVLIWIKVLILILIEVLVLIKILIRIGILILVIVLVKILVLIWGTLLLLLVWGVPVLILTRTTISSSPLCPKFQINFWNDIRIAGLSLIPF
jgi:hypothetical protein